MGEFNTFSWTYLRDSLLNDLSEGVCVFDECERLVTWNDRLPELLERPTSDFLANSSFREILLAYADQTGLDAATRERMIAVLAERGEHTEPLRLAATRSLTLRIKPLTRGLTLALVTEAPDIALAGHQASHAESHYRDLINHTATPVVVHRGGRILFVNKALSAQAGLPPEVFVGHKLDDFLPEDEQQPFEERFKRSEIGLWEVRIKLPDGSIRWAETANAEIEWDGAPARQISFQDITPRKEAEQALERQAVVMQQLAEGVVVVDTDGNVIDCNPSACDILKYNRRDIVGRPATALLPPGNNADALLEEMRQALENDGKWFGELSFTRADGALLYLDVSISSWRSADRTPQGRIIVFRDVTDRRLVEEAAARSEARFRSLIEGSLQGVLIHRDEKIVYVNRAAADLYLSKPESMIGRPVSDFIEPETAKLRHAFLHEEIATPIKIRATRDDGATIWLEVNARSVDWDGEPARQVMINDITERQRAEDALQHAQKLESLGQLTGGIAHDFNNLLGVISGNLELLREQLADSEDHAMFIEASLRSVRRGAELTQRLLAFSRKTPLKPQVLDINKLIWSMTGMLQRTLGETINVETSLSDAAWSVSVDPGQMENALLNLALNARDAMPRGGRLILETENVTLTKNLIRKKSVVPAGEYLRVCIRDTGTGMPAEVLENAFQPFFTTKEVGAGSGLGLSMVYGFVQQSSGHIHIDSTPGRGTTIQMYLPKSAEQLATSGGKRPGDDAPPANKEVVMVVEDDEDLRRLSVVLLNRMGYHTHEAGDGPSALALLAKLNHIDLLFTDLVLPGGMGGFEIAKAAKAQFPGIKVLFTSGYSESETFREAFEDGEAELIPKPYRKDALAKRLQEVLQN